MCRLRSLTFLGSPCRYIDITLYVIRQLARRKFDWWARTMKERVVSKSALQHCGYRYVVTIGHPQKQELPVTCWDIRK